MSAYRHTHSWLPDPVAWHCAWPGCTACTNDPHAAGAVTYGWGVRHDPECSGLRVDEDGACTCCGKPRGIPPFQAPELLGFRVRVDPSMPPGVAEFRDSTGRIVGRIVGLSETKDSSDGKCVKP